MKIEGERGDFETVIDKKPGPSGKSRDAHAELVRNFYDAVRSRNQSDLLAPLEHGLTGAALATWATSPIAWVDR